MKEDISKIRVRPSSVHGKGVFAIVDFRKGDRILEIDDSRVVTDEAPLRAREGEYERHCDYLDGGRVVVMQSPERYINHSCDSNSFVRTVHGMRCVFALRDISVGEEITYDYCINGSGDTVWRCNCGRERCRRIIHSDFFHLPHSLQLAYLPLLDCWFVEENREQVEKLTREAGG